MLQIVHAVAAGSPDRGTHWRTGIMTKYRLFGATGVLVFGLGAGLLQMPACGGGSPIGDGGDAASGQGGASADAKAGTGGTKGSGGSPGMGGTPGMGGAPAAMPYPVPQFKHVFVLLEENTNFAEIFSQNSPAPYLKSL